MINVSLETAEDERTCVLAASAMKTAEQVYHQLGEVVWLTQRMTLGFNMSKCGYGIKDALSKYRRS